MPSKRPKPRLRANGNDLQRLLRNSAVTIEVGVFEGAGNHSSGIRLSELAAIHEFGAPAANIPERSFLRSTLRDPEVRNMLRQAGARYASQVRTKAVARREALGKLGAWMVSRVRQSILSGPGIPPPLAPATVVRKGSSRPLVDTGQLISAIGWRLVKKVRGQ